MVAQQNFSKHVFALKDLKLEKFVELKISYKIRKCHITMFYT